MLTGRSEQRRQVDDLRDLVLLNHAQQARRVEQRRLSGHDLAGAAAEDALPAGQGGVRVDHDRTGSVLQ